jgi:hypothetical protein
VSRSALARQTPDSPCATSSYRAFVHFLVERYWPGVREDEAMAALRRVHAGCLRLAAGGVFIRWVDGMFVPEDETLSSRLDGTSQAVRSVFDIAGEPFDRMMQICRLEPD